jgi:hypothetical protein
MDSNPRVERFDPPPPPSPRDGARVRRRHRHPQPRVRALPAPRLPGALPQRARLIRLPRAIPPPPILQPHPIQHLKISAILSRLLAPNPPPWFDPEIRCPSPTLRQIRLVYYSLSLSPIVWVDSVRVSFHLHR